MSESIIESTIKRIVEELTATVGSSAELLKLKAELDKALYTAIEDMKAAEAEAKKLAEEEAKRAAKEAARNELLQKQTELNEQLKAAQEAMESIEREVYSFKETISNMENLGIPTEAAESKLEVREQEAEKLEAEINKLYNDLNKVEEELEEYECSAESNDSIIPNIPTIHLTAEEQELFSTAITDLQMTVGNYKYINSNGKEVYGLPLHHIKIGNVDFRVQFRGNREDLAPGMDVYVNAEKIKTDDGLRYFAMATVETAAEREERLQEEAKVAAKKEEIAKAAKERKDAMEKAKKDVIAKAMEEAEEGNFATLANFFNSQFGAAK